MRNQFILFIILLFFSFRIAAQHEADKWYFGINCGLDFSPGSPVVLSNGNTTTIEGTAVANDAAGNLLFYTDGITVWDATNTVMSNGTGLLGDQQSTQSALIVKQPGSGTIYFIFTTQSLGGSCNYSVVDMTQNGGLGAVTIKNVLLQLVASERLTAVRHNNGTDFWVIGHGYQDSSFFSYQLTPAGVSASPVFSIAGISQPVGGDEVGYLKASPDGSKLAMAIRYEDLFEIFDFDRSTGIISNAITFPPNFSLAYGVAFSPDGSKLYLSGGITPTFLYQVDMNAGSPTAIINSAVLIATPVTGGAMGTLQLGPDCKIYAAKYNTSMMGVINDPNATGVLCNYNDNQINLTGTGQAGLPNYFEIPSCSKISFSNLCFGDSTQFQIYNTSMLGAVQWNFADIASGALNISSSFSPAHVFTAPGSYNVELIEYLLTGDIDTSYFPVIIHALPVVTLGNDTVICIGDSVLLNAGAGFTNYLWQDGSTAATFRVDSSGAYAVLVSNGFCEASDTIQVSVTSCALPFAMFSSSDTLVCEKKCLDFYDLSTNNPTSWQWLFPNAAPDTSTSQNPLGICFNNYASYDITLIACNGAGCDTLGINDFITIFQSPAQPLISMTDDTLYCISPAVTYQWYLNNNMITGATDSFYVYSQQGSYYCIVGDSNGCQASSVIFVINAIEGNLPGNGVTIFPNPVEDVLNIHFENEISHATISIYDLAGRKLKEVKTSAAPVHYLELDLSGIAAGNYVLSIITAKGNFFSPVIIMR